MSPIEFLSQPIYQRLGWILLHFLWQGFALALLSLFFIRALNLRRGRTRYTVYLDAFLAMALCPVATFLAMAPTRAEAPVTQQALPTLASAPNSAQVSAPTPVALPVAIPAPASSSEPFAISN